MTKGARSNALKTMEKNSEALQAMELQVNSLVSIVRSQLASFIGYSHGGERDLYKVFGYPRDLAVGHLQGVYERGDIANRIIKAFPAATWRDTPVVKDDAGDSAEKLDSDGNANENYSPFVDEFWKLAKAKRLFSIIERADRLASIGRFGIIVMGFKDGSLSLSEPMAKGKKAPLLYLQPYSEASITITQWDTDPQSERFGKPVLYAVSNVAPDGAPAGPSKGLSIHYTRVLHVVESPDTDDCFGQPRLRAVFNRLMDLEKVIGGGAETFWQIANRGIAWNADTNAEFGPAELKEFKEAVEEFSHSQRRQLVTRGITPHVLGSESPDPEMYAEKILDLIAGATGIPKRILIGSERGELSSSQDENNWALRIDERRTHFGIPGLLEPLINILIETGNLPKPQGDFCCEWQKHKGLDPVQEADVNLKRTQALAAYANAPAAELIVPHQEFRRDMLGLEPESEYDLPAEEPLPEDDPNADPAADPAADTTADPGVSDPPAAKQPATNASTPRTLYVSRKVLNAKALTDWAKSQGFKSVHDDLHVTVVYSKTAVDWMSIPEDYPRSEDGEAPGLMIPASTQRVVEEIGPGKWDVPADGSAPVRVGQAVALLFVSSDLAWRRQRFIEAGASHDFPDYQPHVTITYDLQPGLDLSKVEPYTGPIALGPEVFEEIAEG